MIGRVVVTLLLVGAILWLLLGSIGDISEVLDALRQVSAAQAALLVLMTIVWRLLVASQLAASVPALPITQAAVASEGAAAASNAIPGPSGTVMRLTILRSWGHRTEEFANSWLFTASLTNLVVLSAPAAIAVVLVLEGQASTTLTVIALVGLAVSVTGVAVVIGTLRSDRFARWTGRTLGRTVRWLAGIVRRRPSEEDFEAATLRFRDGITATWHHRGGRISLAVVGSYMMLGTLFVTSMRAVGLDNDIASLAALVAVYTGVRLLTVVEVTPGGAGVTEALYTAALLVVTGGEEESVIVAGVLLFRGLSYVGPILLGSVALLVWRAKRSWRVEAQADDPGVAAVTGAMMDQPPD